MGEEDALLVPVNASSAMPSRAVWRRRMAFSEVVRMGARFTRDRWRDLLVIGLIAHVPLGGGNSVLDDFLSAHGTEIGLSRLADISVARLIFDVWLDGVAWMAMALIALAWVASRRMGPFDALRTALRMAWRWVVVMACLGVILTLLGAAGLRAYNSLYDGLETRGVIPTGQVWKYWRIAHCVLCESVDLMFLFVAFSPLSLVLERNTPLEALRSSARHVRGNWTWLVLAWLPMSVLSGAVGFVIDRSAILQSAPWIAAIVWSVFTPALRAVPTLQYLNLAMVSDPMIPSVNGAEAGGETIEDDPEAMGVPQRVPAETKPWYASQ